MQFISNARHIVLHRVYSRFHCNAKTFHDIPGIIYTTGLYISMEIKNINERIIRNQDVFLCWTKNGYSMKYVLHDSTMKRLEQK